MWASSSQWKAQLASRKSPTSTLKASQQVSLKHAPSHRSMKASRSSWWFLRKRSRLPARQGRSNIQEVRARGAFTIVIAEEGDEAVKPYADRLITVPACPRCCSPAGNRAPLQIFACALAEAKGLTLTSRVTSQSP